MPSPSLCSHQSRRNCSNGFFRRVIFFQSSECCHSLSSLYVPFLPSHHHHHLSLCQKLKSIANTIKTQLNNVQFKFPRLFLGVAADISFRSFNPSAASSVRCCSNHPIVVLLKRTQISRQMLSTSYSRDR